MPKSKENSSILDSAGAPYERKRIRLPPVATCLVSGTVSTAKNRSSSPQNRSLLGPAGVAPAPGQPAEKDLVLHLSVHDQHHLGPALLHRDRLHRQAVYREDALKVAGLERSLVGRQSHRHGGELAFGRVDDVAAEREVRPGLQVVGEGDLDAEQVRLGEIDVRQRDPAGVGDREQRPVERRPGRQRFVAGGLVPRHGRRHRLSGHRVSLEERRDCRPLPAEVHPLGGATDLVPRGVEPYGGELVRQEAAAEVVLERPTAGRAACRSKRRRGGPRRSSPAEPPSHAIGTRPKMIPSRSVSNAIIVCARSQR